MPAAADSLGKIVLIHHDVHAMLFLIHEDAADFGRRERIDHECGGIVGPQDDIHPLSGQLASYRLHPGTAHAHAGTDRINTRIVGLNRNLGA